MAFKLIAFAALVVAAQAGVIQTGYHGASLGYAAPAYAKVAAPIAVAKTIVADEYDPHPQYQYAYEIQDALTGDSKSQQESRDGDVVHGSYSLVDPDGTKRTVEYTADDVHGFNAVVHREPLAVKAIAKVAAPVAYAAPVAKYAAPVSYAAPVAKYAAPVSYAAPVAKYAAPVSYASPVSYAAPVAKYAAPVSYASPVSYAAPVAKYAAPLSYSSPVSYAAPSPDYHH